MNIYKGLKKPIIALSPMEDVTDSVFRQVVMSLGKPDLMYTEFVNVEGLNSKGHNRVVHRLRYDKSEHPIIAQLWGITPKNFLKSSKIVREMGFDGVDINMGCSVKNVVKNCAGSALINEDRGLVKEIIEATKEGANGLPVSVKTRLGFNEIDLDWIKFLLEQNLDALTIHMRTARGKDSIYANWSYMDDIIKLRNEISHNTLILGNGDIKSLKEANEKISTYNIDGVLIGRAAVSNPWIFTQLTYSDIPVNEKIRVFKKHLMLFDKVWGNEKDFNSLKKFFRSYINDFNGANELRQQLMGCRNSKEVVNILDLKV
jgi:nifR3 family TIM-barrel protein